MSPAYSPFRNYLLAMLAFGLTGCALPAATGEPPGSSSEAAVPGASQSADTEALASEPTSPASSSSPSPGSSAPSAKSAPAASSRRLALVVGVSDYGGAADLANPVNDANAMAKVLTEVGFEVTKLIDADAEYLTDALAELQAQLGRSGGVGLFYFAGHGLQDGGMSYLMPARSAPFGDAFMSRAVSLNKVLETFTIAKNPMNIVILDACRTPPEVSTNLDRVGQAFIEAPPGTLIAYATAPGNKAYDGAPGTNGVYTGALISEIPKPGVQVENVFKATRSRVYASNQQLPWEATSMLGDFFFVPPAGGAVAPDPPPITVPEGIIAGRARGGPIAEELPPMSPAGLTTLEKVVGAEPFRTSKMAYFEAGTRGRSFTIAQVGRLLGLFEFEGDRFEATRMLRRQIRDPEAAAQLTPHFEFSSTRQKVLELWSGSGDATLTDEEASGLRRLVAAERHARGRLEALDRGTSAKSLTVAQVKLLLGAFRSDREKLDALRKVRGRVSDPQNAAQLQSAFRDSRAKSDAMRLLE